MVDDRRRQLIRRIDNLLEAVEQLRLRGFLKVSRSIQVEVGKVAVELGREASQGPTTISDIHRYLFDLQDLLLSGGPGRRVVFPISAEFPDVGIPFPTLPRWEATDQKEWQEKVRLTVQRLHDFSSYLDAQAQAARESGQKEQDLAVKRAEQAALAKQIYQRLFQEATQVLGQAPVFDPAPTLPSGGRLEIEDLVIDLDTDEVRRGQGKIPFTARERKILAILVANRDRVITREAMLHLIHGDNPRVDLRSRALDVHLSRIRAKLDDPVYLETITGIGFRITTRPAERSGRGSIGGEARRRGQRQSWTQGVCLYGQASKLTRPRSSRRISP